MGYLIAAALAVALVILTLLHQRRTRQLLERARSTLRHVGDDGVPPRTLPEAIDRLAQRASTPDPEDEVGLSQVLTALDETPTGAVIADVDGAVVFRNRIATPFASGRHGDALAEAAIQGRMGDALLGQVTDEDLRLHGPPERILHIVGAPLVLDGELIGGLVLIDDVTEQHRVDAVRRDFVANVSHELRTPVGALSLLAETLQGETDPQIIERFSGRILGETDRLARLIDDLLDLSRIEGGVGDDAVPVDLGVVVREAAGALREAALHKGVELELDIEANRAVVIGDRAQLVSAVTNLFDNAVKYTEPPGRVVGRLATHGDEAAIAVVDTGIGIPQRDLPRLFERFYRVDRGRSAETGGTGLGLSIVRHVAVNHGGRVEVVSQEGVGSTFTMILPNDIRLDEREAA